MPYSGSLNPLTLQRLSQSAHPATALSIRSSCSAAINPLILNLLKDERTATGCRFYKGGFSPARAGPITARARANTASNISSVSLPVLVFCRLG